MIVEGYEIGKIAMGYTVLKVESKKYLLNEIGEIKIFTTQDQAFDEILKLI
jgi:hypothetical protein